MARSILVVDDEPAIAALVAEALADEGYDVRHAPDGLAALAEVDRAPPDLILSDVMMPRLDGEALARRLREHGHRLPVVLMSAVPPKHHDNGAVVVSKPFDLDHLLAVVADRLGQRAPAA